MHVTGVSMGKHWVSQETGRGRIVGQRLYCDFLGKEWVKQGRQAQDWLVRVISAGSGAEEMSLVIGYLALGDQVRCIVA